MTVETANSGIEKLPSGSASPVAGTLAAGLAFVGGLAIGRLLYEWLFPDAAWLGRPVSGLLFATVAAVIGSVLWWALVGALRKRRGGNLASQQASNWSAALPFLPLLLNLGYLLDPAVNPVLGRSLFLASLWLALVLLARLLIGEDRWRWLAYAFILGFLAPVYLATMGRTVGAADTFEFQVVVPQLGIVHPTGYPLYLLLAKPFTWLPFNNVAWRVNLATLVFALVAVCLLYTLIRRWTSKIVPAILAAVIFGLTPTFWSQSIEAEVYSLHALIVAAALLLMREVGGWRLGAGHQSTYGSGRPVFRLTVLLALVLGFGLTNHLTTVILLPAAGLAIFMACRQGRYEKSTSSWLLSVLQIGGAFLLPLLLYTYLPIRWSAVNGEAMGWQRFVDWVIGGRFQDALQLTAWLEDGARYQIVGRLLADEWPVLWGLPLILIGVAYGLYRRWRFALILFITLIGYTFYALNYYVPDLAVFLIPAYLIMAVFWATGLVGLLELADRLLTGRGRRFSELLHGSLVLLAVGPALLQAGQAWESLDSSGDDGRTRWGQAVLELPLAADAAILADSDKFPPLYYLQQAEGVRPDLDIVVLPDETAYRAELDRRLSAGQTVYLARFLPGLEGIYHLSSRGPLTEVSQTPGEMPPATLAPQVGSFGRIQMLGYDLAPESPFAQSESAVTFYWQAAEPQDEVLHVYTRWLSDDYVGPVSSQHPAGNTYPTVAWQAGEVVADYHALPWPASASSSPLSLQVALAPPFAAPETLTWQTIAVVDASPGEPAAAQEQLRMLLGPLGLDGVTISAPIRSETPVIVQVSGYANALESLLLAIVPAGGSTGPAEWQQVNPAAIPGEAAADDERMKLQWIGQLAGDLPAGDYDVLASYAGQAATCGWLARKTGHCVLGQLVLSDAPLPPGAVRFEDKIAMLSIDIAETQLAPGGELAAELTWQALTALAEDYTVFVQVLDEQDRIVGQVDAWPQQGTYPTSEWLPGEIVEDPYLIRLDEALPPGQYKLYVGWYLLETLRRIPVVDEAGRVLDDKMVVPGLIVPE